MSNYTQLLKFVDYLNHPNITFTFEVEKTINSKL